MRWAGMLQLRQSRGHRTLDVIDVRVAAFDIAYRKTVRREDEVDVGRRGPERPKRFARDVDERVHIRRLIAMFVYDANRWPIGRGRQHAPQLVDARASRRVRILRI